MAALQSRGRDAQIYDAGESLAPRTSVVFDAWMLFPSNSNAESSEHLVGLASKLKQKGAFVVLDNCDNQFASTTTRSDWQAGLDRLRRLAAIADVIVCCSEALVQAMHENLNVAAKYKVIDDPIEESIRYPGDSKLKMLLSPARKLAGIKLLALGARIFQLRTLGYTPIVWFGSHGNQFSPGGMLDILPLKETLESVNRSHRIQLTLISNHRRKFDDNFRNWRFPVHYLEWDRANFMLALKLHEISIIPSTDNPFTRCKSTNRLTLSLHQGLSVIADPIPSYLSYSELVKIGNWRESLIDLLSNRSMRRRQLIQAQTAAWSRAGIERIASDWENVLFSESTRISR
jgi:hypothetical protein